AAGRARQRPAHSRQHRYLVPPGDGVLRKAVQAERQPYSGALLQHLEAQPVGLNELGLHIRHPAYRPEPTIPRRRHRPADQWRSERWRDPCTFRLGCHAPLCLTADAERPPAEGDHVDRRCAWGAKRNRAYLPRVSALTRRALPDFAEPYLWRIRIAGNKAASSRSLTSAAGRLRLPLLKTRGIERAPRDHSPTGDRRKKRLSRHF